MALPWFRIIDTIVGLTDLARGRAAAPSPGDTEQLATNSRTLGHLETRLAGVVVAALKEAFDRDTRRLEIEREHMEEERRRAEQALKLELLRQAGDREIGRLRLMAGVAIASWLGTLFFAVRLIGAGAGARATLGVGWALLLAALALSFVAQSRVASTLDRFADARGHDGLPPGGPGAAVPWLIVLGLAAIGAAVLIA
jgi:hypothetical protein